MLSSISNDQLPCSQVSVKSPRSTIAMQKLQPGVSRIRWWGATMMSALGLLFGWQAGAQELPLALFLDPSLFVVEAALFQPASGLAPGTLARLNPSVIERLLTSPVTPPVRLVLNLCSNDHHEVVLERRELLGPGRVVCRGRVEGHPGSYVTLALSGGAMAGSVFIPARGMFQIQYAGNGWQRILKTDSLQLPRCGVERGSGSPPRDADPEKTGALLGGVAFQAASAPGDPTNSIIDLLIVYTAAARDGAGGTRRN